jgi:secreted PhoX family phosphatase
MMVNGKPLENQRHQEIHGEEVADDLMINHQKVVEDLMMIVVTEDSITVIVEDGLTTVTVNHLKVEDGSMIDHQKVAEDLTTDHQKTEVDLMTDHRKVEVDLTIDHLKVEEDLMIDHQVDLMTVITRHQKVEDDLMINHQKVEVDLMTNHQVDALAEDDGILAADTLIGHRVDVVRRKKSQNQLVVDGSKLVIFNFAFKTLLSSL